MFKKKGTAVGTPGGSTQKSSSKLNHAFTKLSWKAKLGLALLGVFVGLVTALATGLNPLSGAALLAAFVLFIAGVASAPAVWGVITILVGYAIFAIPFSSFIITNAAGFIVDLSIATSGGIGLITAAFLAAWFALKFARIAAWKALSWALALSAVAGFVGAYIIPSWGLNTVLAAMAIVTLYHSGLGDALKGAFSWAQEKLSKQERGYVDTVFESDPAAVKVDAERKTAKALNNITEKTMVFHDVTLDRKNVIPHFVISTTGLSLLASFGIDGPVRETKQKGLIIPGVDLGNVVNVLLENRASAAKGLKVREDSIRIVLVLHGEGSASVEGISKTFAAYNADSGKRKVADVFVVSEDELMSLVDTGLDMWSPLNMRAVIRRARLKMKPAHIFNIDQNRIHAVNNAVRLATLDEDGREVVAAVSDAERDNIDWMLPGTQVLVNTSKGLVGDIVIAGSLSRNSESDELLVPVCAIEEWEAAGDDEREPEVHWIKASNISKDSYRSSN